MKALVLEGKGLEPRWCEIEEPVASSGSVVVELRAAALNHRDVWIQKGQYAGLVFPVIPGSDGSGFAEGRPVVINPGMAWGTDSRVQSPAFSILGMPSDGTFAQRVLVPAEQLYPMPEHLSFEEAAAIPLAGVTAYRAVITQGEVWSGERVLVTGIGGGVALWAMQLAMAIGAEVWVTSGSREKLDRAMKLGAAGGFLYRDAAWLDEAKKAGGFDLVVDGAGGEAVSGMLKLMRPGGRFVIYGGSVGAFGDLSPQIIFWKQLRLIGSTMGSPEDFQGLMEMVVRHRIMPVIDRIIPLEHGAEAFRRMAEGKQFGKIVLQIPR